MVNGSEDLEKTYSRKIREADEDSIQELVQEYLMKCAERLKMQIQLDVSQNFRTEYLSDVMSTADLIRELQSQITQLQISQNIWPK